MTGLPETDVVRVRRWCQEKVPEQVRNEVRIEVEVAEHHLTIVECRPPGRADAGSDWTRLPIGSTALCKDPRCVSTVLARPQLAFPRLRPGVAYGQHRGVAR